MFYLEDDSHKEVTFNGETLIFTLQRIKRLNQKKSFQKVKSEFFVLVVDRDLICVISM